MANQLKRNILRIQKLVKGVRGEILQVNLPKAWVKEFNLVANMQVILVKRNDGIMLHFATSDNVPVLLSETNDRYKAELDEYIEQIKINVKNNNQELQMLEEFIKK
jgi:hypothetical protein